MKWHDLLLSHFLAFYPMLQIQFSKRSHCYSFVCELPMEVHSSLLHSESGPPLESNRRDQEVYVLLIKFPHKLFIGQSLLRLERLSAYVLNFVLGEVQSSGYGPVRSKLP